MQILVSKGLRALLMSSAVIGLTACGGGGSSPAPTTVTPPPAGGGGGSTPPPAPAAVSYKLDDQREAYTFLSHASFGPTSEELSESVGQSATDLLRAEFETPMEELLPIMVPRAAAARAAGESLYAQMEASWWGRFLHADDQLRQRTAFALSQIVVKSETTNENFLRNIAMMDIYNRHAFGNYGDFLEEVTYSPMMGDYLTYMYSWKQDDRTGRMPDENYAREIMQLFTIGLVELNMDGTPKLDGQGNTVETYTNEDVIGMARVFTGFRPAFEGDNIQARTADSAYAPMKIHSRAYEEGEKRFLGQTIPEGTSSEDSIKQAIQTLMDHPNTPPFIARQMIQRFTQSHPTPAYVERVATAFAEGSYVAEDGAQFGDGRRGDMKAMLAAILLDAQFYDDVPPAPEDKKLREPILRMAHMLRAVEFANDDPEMHRYVFSRFGRQDKLGMAVMEAPSVFNYYRPGHQSPGSETQARGLTAPELQILSAGSIRGFSDAVTEFIFAASGNNIDPTSAFFPTFTREVELESDPDALVDHLNDLLVNGNLSDVTRTRILDALVEMPVRDDDRYRERDRLGRARLAIWFVVTSTDFAVTQ